MSLADLQNMFLNPDLLERYGPRFIDGLLVTGKLVAISFTLGALLGLLIALGRLSSNRFLRSFTGAYVYFFRGSPLLAQLFLLYYGLGSFKGFWQDVGLWWFFREFQLFRVRFFKALPRAARIQRRPRGLRTKAKQKLYHTIELNLHRRR